MNRAQALLNISLGNRFTLNTGASFRSQGLSLKAPEGMPEATTELRSFSGSAILGLSVVVGRHRLFARGEVGGVAVLRHIRSETENSTDDETSAFFEGGGQIGWSYDRYVSVILSGRASKFNPNPASLRAHGELHKGWVKDAFPSMELDVLVIRSMSPDGDKLHRGGIELRDLNMHGRLLGFLPLINMGPIVPSLLLGGELTVSGESTSGGVIVGGVASLGVKGIKVEAGAAWSSAKALLFILRGSYGK
jgi:hypothetical protein